jgi:glycosyltransferase involved in cell wall biosynthesis
VHALVFGGRAEELRLAARTMRALRVAGVDATDVTRASADEIARVLATAERATWLVRAGAWLRGRAPTVPASSATGRALCAIGRIASGRASEVAAWDAALAKTGGDLSSLDGASLPPLASTLLEHAAARALAHQLSSGVSIDAALTHVVASRDHRAVRVPALDVHDDPGLRVTIAITSLQQGGAERLALDLARGLGARGVAAEIAALGRTSRRELAVPPGVTARLSKASARVDRLRDLGRAAVAFGADTLHAHLFTGDDLHALASCGVPIAVTVHNARISWPVGLGTVTSADAALLVACSQSVEADLFEAFGRGDATPPTRTIWNGIARPAAVDAGARVRTRRALEIPDDAVALLAVANPRRQKRLELLPAIASAAETRLARDVYVVVAGAAGSDDDSRDAERTMRAAIVDTKREYRFRCLGSVDDVSALHAACDVFVSCSGWEGLSLAQLEALAGGLPVVATNVGGAAEVASRSDALSLVDVDAAPDAFAEAIARAASASARAALPPDFTSAKMVERHVDILRRVACTAAKTAARAAKPRTRTDAYFVMNNVSVGGAQSSARRLALGFAARGLRARFAVLQEREDHPTPGLAALRAAGIPVFVPPPARDPADTVTRILDDLDAEPTRAVFFWNAITEHKLLFADGCLDVPMIDVSPGEMLFASMEAYFERPRAGLPYRSGRDFGRRLSSAVVKYRAEAERAASFFGAPVHVIPNGVPLGAAPVVRGTHAQPDQRGDRERPLIIGTAARISPQKKLGDLVDALLAARDRLPPFVLRVAGAPERGAHAHAEELRARAKELPVEWVGEHGDVRPFLDELDLFVMISEPAGCPNASLEAMAAGLPIVATAVGGAVDQIAHGESGLLTPPGSASALADALVDAARDRVRLLAWGREGRRRAERLFDVERMVDDYARLIDLVST